MATFFVDDHFPEHPKALAAGDEACWLYVCGLAYVRRNDTSGTIPKSAAGRLVARKGPVLAKRLVAAGLWHDDGDVYRIHDYDEFNARSLAKRDQARSAAKLRWAKERHAIGTSEPDADALRPQYGNDASADADASVSQCPNKPVIQVSKQQQVSGVSHDPPGEPVAAAASKLVDQALRLIAQRQLATAGNVNNPEGWLRGTVAGLRKDLESLIALSDLHDFEGHPQKLADWLKPPPPPAKPKPSDVGEMAVAAQKVNIDRKSQPPCPTCGTRGGFGWVDTTAGTVHCTDCTPKGATA